MCKSPSPARTSLPCHRWREESKALGGRFEASVAELREEVMRHKRRSEELSLQLNHLKLSRDEVLVNVII